MKLKYFHIENYRNLNKVELHLNDELNFLVGENDMGKSNFLDLLSTLFTRRNFSEDDFLNKNEAIKIIFQIKLAECERGAFDDLFTPEPQSDEHELTINIIAEQLTPEDDMEFTHKETQSLISYTRFRALNFIKNSSTTISKDEFDVHKNKGAGKFLNYLIKKFVENNESSNFIKKIKNHSSSKKLLKYTGDNINKIEFLKKFDISIDLEGNINDLLCRMLEVKAKNRDIQDSGQGIQYSFLIILFILEKIINIFNYKNNEDRICKEEDGKQSISLVLALDEPEVHQHPYMQRNLIKSIKSIIENKNESFLGLIKEHFDLDSINGQILIVTHSPNIILSNYKNIVRFYKTKDIVQVKSGAQIELEESKEKHLLMHFDSFKEAFFSRGVILVEGKTEEGLIPYWAEKSGIDFDELGICLISVDGAGGIKPLLFLCNEFKIPYVAIMDKDVYETDEECKKLDIISTSKKEIEGDIIDKIEQMCKLDQLLSIHNAYYSNFNTAPIGNLQKIIDGYKYRVPLPNTQGNDLFYRNINTHQPKIKKIMLLYWLWKNKSITLGRHLATELDIDCIPTCLNKAFKEIKNKVKQ
ncbi:MAG: AAA family ATPase [Candidatus Woesearchaeota archaeon]|jgi:putative ATP-dependent endonuclease of OLD family